MMHGMMSDRMYEFEDFSVMRCDIVMRCDVKSSEVMRCDDVQHWALKDAAYIMTVILCCYA